MAKKKIVEEEKVADVLDLPMEDIFADRFDRYAREIIPDRSLPDARDGLKPVQRRILFAMHKDGNVYGKPYRKSAKTVGLVIGNYHPHGDSSVYEAMVRLSQNWKMREPLVDMHGNNGSIDDDPAAAMRYTEARLSEISALLLKDLDQDTVPFALNFDDTEEEPTVLPAAYPNLLVNGAKGMAIGYATNMPPHNLEECINAAIYRINHPDCSLDDLMTIIKGPDFPTGGIVQGKQGIIDMYTNGQGKFIVRSKTEIVETKTCNQIVITEIPYEVVKSDLVKQMDDVRLDKEVQGILDVRDESDRTGLKIVVDVRKENDVEMILNYLLKKTSLQVSYAANMTAIVNKTPKVLGLRELLDAYVEHRKIVTTNRCKYQLAKIQDRTHILEGLIKCVSILDEVIRVIRKSKDKGDAKKNICNEFGFTERQAEAIVTLQLYRLSSTDIVELKEEYAKLMATMELLKGILAHEDLMRQLIIKELREVITQCGSPRRSEIQDQVEEIVINKQKMIVNERVMLTVSSQGYVKRVSIRSYNASDKSQTGLKLEDELVGAKEVDLLDHLVLITDNGNYVAMPIFEIDEFKWKELGTHFSNYTNSSGNEKVLAAYTVKTYDTEAWVVTVSEKGMIKRTPFAALKPSRTNKLVSLMNLKKDDRVVDVKLIYRDDQVMVISKSGNGARYLPNQIPQTGLKAQGVKAMNLAKDDTVATLATIHPKSLTLALFTTTGASKRVKLSDISLMNRPVKGDSLCKKVKSNPSMLRYAVATQTYDEILFGGDEMTTVVSKDVSLMANDASFSNTVKLPANWYLVKGIEEVELMAYHPDDPNTEDVSTDGDNSNGEFEVLSLNV